MDEVAQDARTSADPRARWRTLPPRTRPEDTVAELDVSPVPAPAPRRTPTAPRSCGSPSRASDGVRSSRGPRVRAPRLVGRRWLNSPALAPEDLRGRVVLLDFWTSSCVNCLHVLDELRPLQEAFADALVTVGVHSPKFPHEADPAALDAAVRRLGVHHPVLDDADLVTWRAYAARAWPTLVLLDPDGYVVATLSGRGTRPSWGPSWRTSSRSTAGGTLRRNGSRRFPSGPSPRCCGSRPAPSRCRAGRSSSPTPGHHQLVELDEDLTTESGGPARGSAACRTGRPPGSPGAGPGPAAARRGRTRRVRRRRRRHRQPRAPWGPPGRRVRADRRGDRPSRAAAARRRSRSRAGPLQSLGRRVVRRTARRRDGRRAPALGVRPGAGSCARPGRHHGRGAPRRTGRERLVRTAVGARGRRVRRRLGSPTRRRRRCGACAATPPGASPTGPFRSSPTTGSPTPTRSPSRVRRPHARGHGVVRVRVPRRAGRPGAVPAPPRRRGRHRRDGAGGRHLQRRRPPLRPRGRGGDDGPARPRRTGRRAARRSGAHHRGERRAPARARSRPGRDRRTATPPVELRRGGLLAVEFSRRPGTAWTVGGTAGPASSSTRRPDPPGRGAGCGTGALTVWSWPTGPPRGCSTSPRARGDVRRRRQVRRGLPPCTARSGTCPSGSCRARRRRLTLTLPAKWRPTPPRRGEG